MNFKKQEPAVLRALRSSAVKMIWILNHFTEHLLGFFVVIGIAFGLLALPSYAEVRPSQVLVLYNADWIGDAPLTGPGQDSREIAEHYVRMHTDPAAGERPHVLGLRCAHGANHLNAPELAEGSSDNGSGVVLRRSGRVVGSAGEMRDSRALEFTLPKAESPWRFETLSITLKPNRGQLVKLVAGGQSLHGQRVAVQRDGEWHVRANARAFQTGPFMARASCEDGEGKLHRWEAEYQDVFDVSCSRTGVDGVRDDQNYLDDVETQVKAFLDDPKSARPNGTLLKDHVLFVVIGYGLPKTAPATYGIARGVTDSPGDHGAIIGLGQRLQIAYYDVEGALGFAPKPHRFVGRGPFTAYWYRAPQAWPLYGQRANPFLDPGAYQKEGGQGGGLAFTSENRRRFPGRHLFFVSRVDGMTPLEARGLIDRSVYASVYGGPGMGLPEQASGILDEKDEKILSEREASRNLREHGYQRLGVAHGKSKATQVEFLRLKANSGFFNQTDGFLPGGIAGFVTSSNLWGSKTSELRRYLAEGVTATAGGAWVRRKSAHIHSKSWWDDKSLYRGLLQGQSLGSCLLANQTQLEWVTSFVGDPLMRFPPTPRIDVTRPTIEWSRDVRATVHARVDGERAVWVRVDLPQGPGEPEVAQLRLTSGGATALCQTFEAVPYAVVGEPEEVLGKLWMLELLDPYGNRFTATGAMAASN